MADFSQMRDKFVAAAVAAQGLSRETMKASRAVAIYRATADAVDALLDAQHAAQATISGGANWTGLVGLGGLGEAASDVVIQTADQVADVDALRGEATSIEGSDDDQDGFNVAHDVTGPLSRATTAVIQLSQIEASGGYRLLAAVERFADAVVLFLDRLVSLIASGLDVAADVLGVAAGLAGAGVLPLLLLGGALYFLARSKAS